MDVSKHPDVADLAVRECEHCSPGIFESPTSRCESEHFSLVGACVGESGKRQILFCDGGVDLVVEVGSERLDVIDVVAEAGVASSRGG